MEVLWSNCFWMASKILPMLQHLRCFGFGKGRWLGCWGLDSMKVGGGGRTLAWCFFFQKRKVGLIDINDFSCRLEETKRNMSGSTTYSYLFCELW